MTRLRLPMHAPPWLRLVIVAAALLLSGCNAVKLTYNNAQPLTYWWLDGYVDFRKEQKPLVQQSLAALHGWHRQQELPLYLDLLHELQSWPQATLSGDQVCAMLDKTRQRTAALNQRIASVVDDIAPSLDARQVRHIRETFEDKNAEWQEKWLEGSQEERLKRRSKEAVKQLESFYGRLTQAQLDRLRQRLAATGFEPERVYQERLRRQQQIMGILEAQQQKRISAQEAGIQTRHFLNALTEPTDATYREYLDRVTAQTCATIAELHNSMDQEQRQQAARKVQSYVDDVTVLIGPSR